MIDIGCGPPVVMVPGIQGRWEWMRPAVEALARRGRVITFSLPGEPGSGRPMSASFDGFVDQIDEIFERAGLARAAICGVSYGGLIAVRYAALRPSRATALVLVSAMPPGWTPDTRVGRYRRAPRLMAPMFCAAAIGRFHAELRVTFPGLVQRTTFAARHGWRVVTAPLSPSRMSARVELLEAVPFAADCARVSAPTLVLTGEPGVDRVVAVERTQEYGRAIPGAHVEVLERTGHIGLVTRPDRFAELVAGFITNQQAAAPAAAVGVGPHGS